MPGSADLETNPVHKRGGCSSRPPPLPRPPYLAVRLPLRICEPRLNKLSIKDTQQRVLFNCGAPRPEEECRVKSDRGDGMKVVTRATVANWLSLGSLSL